MGTCPEYTDGYSTIFFGEEKYSGKKYFIDMPPEKTHNKVKPYYVNMCIVFRGD